MIDRDHGGSWLQQSMWSLSCTRALNLDLNLSLKDFVACCCSFSQ